MENGDDSLPDLGGRAGGPLRYLHKAASLVYSGITFITRNGQLMHRSPISSPSDVAELEYVSALHQCSSMQALRSDGSINAKEIANFLSSRHGIAISAAKVRGVILRGLTADYNDGNNECEDRGDNKLNVLDLVELVSLIIIPNLLRMRHKFRDSDSFILWGGGNRNRRIETLRKHFSQTKRNSVPPTCPKANEEIDDDISIFEHVLSQILEDCTMDSSPKALSADLVKDILRGYGEDALAEDQDLVNEMVEAATTEKSISGETQMLHLYAFIDALTSDVARQYDPGRDTRHSTNLQDVWDYRPKVVRDTSCRDLDEGQNKKSNVPSALLVRETFMDNMRCRKAIHENPDDSTFVIDDEGRPLVRQRYTNPSIDYTIDGFRTRFHVVFLWITLIAFWLAYLGIDNGYTCKVCNVLIRFVNEHYIPCSLSNCVLFDTLAL